MIGAIAFVTGAVVAAGLLGVVWVRPRALWIVTTLYVTLSLVTMLASKHVSESIVLFAILVLGPLGMTTAVVRIPRVRSHIVLARVLAPVVFGISAIALASVGVMLGAITP